MDTMDSEAGKTEPSVVNSPCEDNRYTVGGPCEYSRYKGKAVITSITPKAMPGYHTRPLYESYEVKFRFVTQEEIKESYGKVQGKEHVLRLANSWYPGPKFLQKYNIEVGKSFDCYLNVITKGTCKPIIFDFPSIDLRDYFEIKG
jgi:hypothetical protein